MEINVEELAKQKIVASVLETLTDEQRDELIGNALSNILKKDLFGEWTVKHALEADSEKYLYEYIKRKDTQLRIKENAEKSFDNVIAQLPSLFENNVKRALSNIGK